MSHVLRAGILLSAAILLTGCARSDALWGGVDKLCLNNHALTKNTAPCHSIYVPEGNARGFSVIQNPRYPYHFILVPTIKVSGIEDPQLFAESSVDYFGYAWLMRYLVSWQYGAQVPDDMLGMAVNSASGRSQDQLHIHLTCLREDVRRQMLAERPYIQERWTPMQDKLLKNTYYARKVVQPTAMGIYPVKSVSDYFHLSPEQMAEWGVALIPTHWSGQKGFILLTTRRGWDKGNRASVESLLDKECSILPAK